MDPEFFFLEEHYIFQRVMLKIGFGHLKHIIYTFFMFKDYNVIF